MTIDRGEKKLHSKQKQAKPEFWEGQNTQTKRNPEPIQFNIWINQHGMAQNNLDETVTLHNTFTLWSTWVCIVAFNDLGFIVILEHMSYLFITSLSVPFSNTQLQNIPILHCVSSFRPRIQTSNFRGIEKQYQKKNSKQKLFCSYNMFRFMIKLSIIILLLP